LNGTKVQYLGNLHPDCYNRDLFDSFVYTPTSREATFVPTLLSRLNFGAGTKGFEATWPEKAAGAAPL